MCQLPQGQRFLAGECGSDFLGQFVNKVSSEEGALVVVMVVAEDSGHPVEQFRRFFVFHGGEAHDSEHSFVLAEFEFVEQAGLDLVIRVRRRFSADIEDSGRGSFVQGKEDLLELGQLFRDPFLREFGLRSYKPDLGVHRPETREPQLGGGDDGGGPGSYRLT